MVILISSPSKVSAEAPLINRLFDEGLELCHIRRPNASEKDVRSLIEQIESRYHNKLTLHQHHQLADDYAISRLHFTEHMRLQLTSVTAEQLKHSGFTLTTSVHCTQSFSQLNGVFSYSFIGPVFNSISKPGYNAHPEAWNTYPPANTKAIALGGITANNIHYLKGHFDGVAVLGAIWCSKSPVDHFLQLRKLWNM